MTDDSLHQYVTAWRTAIIGDSASAQMCAAISDPLCAALAIKGMRTMVMESDLGECNHVFLKLDDGRVLDPTADQFNAGGDRPFPRIYLGQATRLHKPAVERLEWKEWLPLMREFQRLDPDFSARRIGAMVRMTLATLPATLCRLPD